MYLTGRVDMKGELFPVFICDGRRWQRSLHRNHKIKVEHGQKGSLSSAWWAKHVSHFTERVIAMQLHYDSHSSSVIQSSSLLGGAYFINVRFILST